MMGDYKVSMKTGMRWRSLLALIVLSAAAAPEAAGQFCEYEATVIRYPLECSFGEVQTIANGLNDNGWVVGEYWCPIWEGSRGFYRTPEGVYVDIGLPPGGTSVQPGDINNNLQICGTATVDGRTRGFIYQIDSESWTVIHPDNPLRRALVNSINDAGQVCGWFDSGEVPGTAFLRHADGAIVELEVDGTRARAINNRGVVVGGFGVPTIEGFEGFVWDGETVTWMGFIPGGSSSFGTDINDLSEVSAQGMMEIVQSFVWNDGATQLCGSLPGLEVTAAWDIALTGVVSGGARDPNAGGRWTAFLCRNGNIVELNTLVTNSEVGTFEDTTSVNRHGEWLAFGHDPQNTIVGYLLDPVDPSLADADGDCDSDVWDLIKVLQDWGQSISPADFDGNGVVNVSDLLMVLANWG